MKQCLYCLKRINFTFLQSLEAGWVTSRQIEAAVFDFVLNYNKSCHLIHRINLFDNSFLYL